MKKMILLSLLTVFFALAGCGFSPSIEVIPPGSRERAREFKVQALHNWHPGLQLAELKGKVVLLVFWATWCGPYRMEMPELIQLYDKYHAQGLEVLGLSTEVQDMRPQGYFNDFISKMGVDYPMALAGTETIADYGIQGIPAVFFIDKKGKVALSFVGVHPKEDFISVIDQLLKETPDR